MEKSSNISDQRFIFILGLLVNYGLNLLATVFSLRYIYYLVYILLVNVMSIDIFQNRGFCYVRNNNS